MYNISKPTNAMPMIAELYAGRIKRKMKIMIISGTPKQDGICDSLVKAARKQKL